jgi:AcrR family transcriptional regulator
VTVTSDRSRTGGRLPRGPHRLTPDQVADDQRARLTDAMVELAGARGFAGTTVADLIGHAGISRKSFYALYADREELLKSTFAERAGSTFEEVAEASRRTGGATRQLEALTRRLCRIAEAQPGLIALLAFEIVAAGPDGLVMRAELIDRYGELIERCLDGEGHRRLPRELSTTLAGAIHREIDAQLREGRTHELAELAPQLAAYARRSHPVPPTLDLGGEPALDSGPTSSFGPISGSGPLSGATPISVWPRAGHDGLLGGRAPGTLTLAPSGYAPHVGKRSRAFESYANRERILDATAQLVDLHGYGQLTAEAIAERADLSERAFLAHFKSRDEAFAAALELGHTKGQAIVERARAAGPDWPTGVRRAVHALLEFFASEPAFASLAFLAAPLAGPKLARRCHEHAGAYGALLLDGAPQRRRPPFVAWRLAAHALFELAYRHAAQGLVAELPRAGAQATYLVLAPYLGVTEAAQLAAPQKTGTG